MKSNINLTDAEERLAALIWQNAPLSSPDLVTLAARELKWKKSTTYTVLKKLCHKGVFENKDAQVTVLLTRDEQIALQSRRYVEDTFGGSLPRFITAFFGGTKLTPKQAAELRQLIDSHEEEENG